MCTLRLEKLPQNTTTGFTAAKRPPRSRHKCRGHGTVCRDRTCRFRFWRPALFQHELKRHEKARCKTASCLKMGKRKPRCMCIVVDNLFSHFLVNVTIETNLVSFIPSARWGLFRRQHQAVIPDVGNIPAEAVRNFMVENGTEHLRIRDRRCIKNHASSSPLQLVCHHHPASQLCQ